MIFRNKETGVIFSYENLTDRKGNWYSDFQHKILLSNTGEFRYGTVYKTVAHVCVDEDEYGNPVIEKWKIKQEGSQS